ncbi:MAG: energy transducer TonB [Neisseriaceae bacterium]
MDHEKYTKSNVISLILHIVIAWALFSIKSAHILTPSRSDGIEVALINSDDLEQPKPVIIKTTPVEQVKTVDNSADINLNQPKVEKKPAPVVKSVTPPPQPTKPATPPEQKKEKPKVKKKPNSKITNSLLSQLGDPENIGKSRGKAVGGTQGGTSDSNVLANNYADLVISAVRPYIGIPDGIDKSATAVVKVVLLPNMRVYKVQLKKSSGNPAYDNSVQEAIKKVAVFPPLPEGAKFVDFKVLNLNFHPE